jgi:hypothetical protein
MSAEGRSPSLARVREPDRPEQQGARRGYSVVKLELQRNVSGTPTLVDQQEVTAMGTHIYLAELNGSDSVSVKLDVPGAGWIEMEEGDIVSREFTRFWIRSNSRFGSSANGFRTLGGPCEATFYVSFGPMILRAPKKYGFRSGFFTVGGVATTIGVDAFGGFATQYAALFPKGLPAYGKYGGTILIRNRDTTNAIYVYMGTVGSFVSASGVYPDETTSIEIPAGVTLPLLVENRLANLRHPDGANRANTLIVACATGAPPFTVTPSRMIFDFSDPESIPAGSGVVALPQ